MLTKLLDLLTLSVELFIVYSFPSPSFFLSFRIIFGYFIALASQVCPLRTPSFIPHIFVIFSFPFTLFRTVRTCSHCIQPEATGVVTLLVQLLFGCPGLKGKSQVSSACLQRLSVSHASCLASFLPDHSRCRRCLSAWPGAQPRSWNEISSRNGFLHLEEIPLSFLSNNNMFETSR